MGSGGICRHGRVRTTCPSCRLELRRANPSAATPVPVPLAQPHHTSFLAGRADAKTESFYQALETFVEREKAAAYARYKQNLEAELDVRLAGARAIRDVEVVEASHAEGGAEWARLKCKENASKFRVGTSLLLHRGDPSAGIPCRLLTDGELDFRVGAEFRQRMKGLTPGNGWINVSCRSN